MTDVVTFVRERLAEDERLAKAANEGAWAAFTTADYLPDGVPQHASRQGPGRTLRAVTAKQHILDKYADAGLSMMLAADEHDQERYAARVAGLLCAIRALAGEWSTHHDYRQDWAT